MSNPSAGKFSGKPSSVRRFYTGSALPRIGNNSLRRFCLYVVIPSAASSPRTSSSAKRLPTGCAFRGQQSHQELRGVNKVPDTRLSSARHSLQKALRVLGWCSEESLIGFGRFLFCPYVVLPHAASRRRDRRPAMGRGLGDPRCHSERSRGPRHASVLRVLGWCSEESLIGFGRFLSCPYVVLPHAAVRRRDRRPAMGRGLGDPRCHSERAVRRFAGECLRCKPRRGDIRVAQRETSPGLPRPLPQAQG